MSEGPNWPGMFKALADAWHWHPDQVQDLTPQQVILLSSQSGDDGGVRIGGGGGGKISLSSSSEIAYWRERWLAAHSDEALLARAEKKLARELERRR